MTKYWVELVDEYKHGYEVEADSPAKAIDEAEIIHRDDPKEPMEINAGESRVFDAETYEEVEW